MVKTTPVRHGGEACRLADRYRIERSLAEIRTTANLQHPLILSLFDSGSVDGTVLSYAIRRR